MTVVPKIDKGAADMLRRARTSPTWTGHADRKHALALMQRGFLQPADDRGFKAYRFALTTEGRAALEAYDAVKNKARWAANEAAFITVILRDFESYRAAMTGERRELCDTAIDALKALEIPFPK